VKRATLEKHEEEKFHVFQEVPLLNKHTQNRSTDEPKKIYLYIHTNAGANERGT
jgi:hypothetical protein